MKGGVHSRVSAGTDPRLWALSGCAVAVANDCARVYTHVRTHAYTQARVPWLAFMINCSPTHGSARLCIGMRIDMSTDLLMTMPLAASKSYGHAIGGIKELWPCHWRHQRVMAMPLAALKRYGHAIGGIKELWPCHWRHQRVMAMPLAALKHYGHAIGGTKELWPCHWRH